MYKYFEMYNIYSVRPCVQNAPQKTDIASLLPHPRESGQEVVQEPGGVTTCPTLVRPVIVWSQQYYLKLLLTVRYSEPFWVGCPRDPPWRKSDHENE